MDRRLLWGIVLCLIWAVGCTYAEEFIAPEWAKNYKPVVEKNYSVFELIINGDEVGTSVEVSIESDKIVNFVDKSFVLQLPGFKHRKKLLKLLNKSFTVDNRFLCRLQEGVCQMPKGSRVAVSLDAKKKKLYLFLPSQFGFSRSLLKRESKVWVQPPKTSHWVYKQNLVVSPLVSSNNNELSSQLLLNLGGNASEGNQYFYYNGIGNLSDQNNNQQNFRLNQIAYGRYDGFFDTEIGLVGGGGGVFVRGQQVWGVDIDKSDAIVSQRSRALVDRDLVTITLEQESVVKVYNGTELISTQILAPGIQNLLTSSFPPINGTLRIDIFDANERLIRTIYRDFNNRGALPSALFNEWRISAGVVQQNGRDFIQINHNQRVFSDHAGWLNSFNIYQTHPYFESSLAYVDNINVSPTFFLDPQNSVTGWGLRLSGSLLRLLSYSVNWRNTGGYLYPQDSAIINSGFSVNLRRSIRLPRGFNVDFFSGWDQAAVVESGYDQTLRASIRKNVNWSRYMFTYGLTLSSTAFAASANRVASGQRENGIFFTLNINKIISEYPNSGINFDVRSNNNGWELPNVQYTRDSLPDDKRPWRHSQWLLAVNSANQTIGYNQMRHTYSANMRALRGNKQMTLSGNYTTSWVFSPYGIRQIANQMMTGYGVYSRSKQYKEWILDGRFAYIPSNGFALVNQYTTAPRVFSYKDKMLPFGSPTKKSYVFPHLIEVLPPLFVTLEHEGEFTLLLPNGKPADSAVVVAPKPCFLCMSTTDSDGKVNLSFSNERKGYYVAYPLDGMPCRFSGSQLSSQNQGSAINCQYFDF